MRPLRQVLGRRGRLAAAGTTLLLVASVVIAALLPTQAARSSGSPEAISVRSYKRQVARVQAGAAAADARLAREHSRAVEMVTDAAGQQGRWRVIAATGSGAYLVESDHGFCFEVRTAYWPHATRASVIPAGRFAAYQAPGVGC